MRKKLSELKPGTHFRIPDLRIRGELVSLNVGSATVRYVREGESRQESFTTADGQTVRFVRPPRREDWSLATEVIVD